MGRPKKEDYNATDYKRQFNEQKYDRIYPWFPKGRKAIYAQAAKDAGLSINEFCREALDAKTREIIGSEKFDRLMEDGKPQV